MQTYSIWSPRLKIIGSTVATFAIAMGVGAHEYYAEFFKIIHPWALPTAAGASVAEIYLRFEEISEDDRLLSATSSFAGSVKFVDASGDEMPTIALRRETTLELQPRGMHIEMCDLTVPFQYGRSYPLTLVFDKGGIIQTEISIGAH
jgi:periplasmic copper chaperone A